jgi:cytoskeletal protein CcmA (bactofilin family)
MKRFVKRIIIKGQRGHGLDLVLILLGVGGLILAPLLGLMNTGLAAGEVFESKTDQLYAADGGIECGIWHLEQGGSADDILELTLNDNAVTVEMEELPHACNELATYEITSTAISQDGSSTSVLAHVTGLTVYMDELLLDAHAGTVYIPNNVYVEGDVTLACEVHIVGDLKAGGNVILNQGSIIGGIVCVAGDLTLNNNATIEAAVYVGGNLALNNLAIIQSDLNVMGTVYLGGSMTIIGDIHSNGSVTISSGQLPLVDGNICSNGNVSVNGKPAVVDGDVYAGGTITGSGTITGTKCPGGACGVCGVDPCPLGLGHPEIKVWVIL